MIDELDEDVVYNIDDYSEDIKKSTCGIKYVLQIFDASGELDDIITGIKNIKKYLSKIK